MSLVWVSISHQSVIFAWLYMIKFDKFCLNIYNKISKKFVLYISVNLMIDSHYVSSFSTNFKKFAKKIHHEQWIFSATIYVEKFCNLITKFLTTIKKLSTPWMLTYCLLFSCMPTRVAKWQRNCKYINKVIGRFKNVAKSV